MTNILTDANNKTEDAKLRGQSASANDEHAVKAPDFDTQAGALRQEFEEIARAEMRRRRGRLGELTPEQEWALESLLISAANNIARPLIEVMRRNGSVEHAAQKTSALPAFALAA
jgi:hypothetical protein